MPVFLKFGLDFLTEPVECGNDKSLVLDSNFFISSAVEINGAGATGSRT